MAEILYALNLNEEKRVLSACYDNDYVSKKMVRVKTLPKGDLHDYLYIDGEYVYSPLGEEKDV